MLSPEELLQKRYKIIAKDTSGNLKVGQVLIHDEEANVFWCGKTCFTEDQLKSLHHLFQPLPWYVDRKREDMPAYLKLNDKILKVESWDYDAEDDLYFDSEEDGKGYMPWNTIPATEADYLTYKNKNNG